MKKIDARSSGDIEQLETVSLVARDLIKCQWLMHRRSKLHSRGRLRGLRWMGHTRTISGLAGPHNIIKVEGSTTEI
jgi:hypothetical protein